MRRWSGRIIGICGWTASALVLVICLLFARLLYSPVDISFTKTIIQDQASQILPGWDVDFEDAIVGWDWLSVRPWVSIKNLQLIDRKDRLRASVPDMSLGVSFTSVFGGLSFSSAELNQMNVVITDLAGFSDAQEKGMLDDLFDENGLPRAQVLRPLTEAFSRFGARLIRSAPALDRVSLQNASIELYRGENLSNSHLSLPVFTLVRDEDELLVNALADIRLSSMITKVKVEAEAEPDVGEMSATLTFSDLMPSIVAKEFKLPQIVEALQFPVSLDLKLDLATNVGLRSTEFTLSADEGMLQHPDSFPEGGEISFVTMSGRYDVAEQMMVVKQLEAKTAKRLITGAGLIYWEEGNNRPGIKLELNTDEVTIPEVLKYWPVKRYPNGEPRGARRWVTEHMKKGLATDVRFLVDYRPDGTGAFENDSVFELTFGVKDVDTLYLKTMPPILGGVGKASLTRQVFQVELSAGTVMGMPVKGSTAYMKDIHIKNGAVGLFDLRARGSVPTVLDLISYPPLQVPQKAKFDPTRLDGIADVEAFVTVPLIKNAPKELIKYNAKAHITEAKVDQLLGGEGIRGGDLDLTVTPDLLTVAGTGQLNGVSLDMNWREDFAAGRESENADTSQVVLAGNIDEEDLKALSVDISEFIHGKAAGEAIFLGRGLKLHTGYFSADGSSAHLMVPQLGWHKPIGVPAMVTGKLDFDDQGIHLAPFSARGENIDVDASFHWGPSGSGNFNGEFDLKKLGKNVLKGSLHQEAGAKLQAVISADVFDASPFFMDADKNSVQGNIALENADSSAFSLDLKADSLLLANGERLERAILKTDFDDGEPKTVFLTASIPGPVEESSKLIVEVEPLKSEKGNSTKSYAQEIRVESDSAGALLRGMGLFAHLKGGKARLKGTTEGWGSALSLKAKLKVDDANLVAKSALNPQVSEGVVSGLDKYLEDGAVQLDEIRMPFDYNAGLLDINNMRAHGPTLGMTMEGQLEAATDRVNMNGVIVPAYGLNSLIGKIPLVGNILTGGKGKGVFGISYRIKGAMEKPDVSVNPLSTLAPGFLRLFFEGSKGKVADVPVQPQKPPAEAEKEATVQPLDTVQ